MFGKLTRRISSGSASPGKDKAIIHQSVPDEVLYPDGKKDDPVIADQSWLNSIPSGGDAAKATPETARAPMARAEPAPRPEPVPVATVAEADFTALFDTAPNGPSAARPRFPRGWLVVVEGPGTGEWFLLEDGVTHLGAADDQTVRLNFGDISIASTAHAAIAYDDASHGFVLSSPSALALRLNGIETTTFSRLRDGDVIGLGTTALRLVALCSPNFHWPKDRP